MNKPIKHTKEALAASARELMAKMDITTDEPFVAQRNAQAAWLREVANALEHLPNTSHVRTAFAFFLEKDGEPDRHGRIPRIANVQCGGFADDKASARYFLAALRNLGFKE